MLLISHIITSTGTSLINTYDTIVRTVLYPSIDVVSQNTHKTMRGSSGITFILRTYVRTSSAHNIISLDMIGLSSFSTAVNSTEDFELILDALDLTR